MPGLLLQVTAFLIHFWLERAFGLVRAGDFFSVGLRRYFYKPSFIVSEHFCLLLEFPQHVDTIPQAVNLTSGDSAFLSDLVFAESGQNHIVLSLEFFHISN